MHSESEEPKKESPNWADYMSRMGAYVENREADQLEDLLMEPHPVLPGELEAFNWLQANAGRELRVKLDDDGYHVIPKK